MYNWLILEITFRKEEKGIKKNYFGGQWLGDLETMHQGQCTNHKEQSHGQAKLALKSKAQNSGSRWWSRKIQSSPPRADIKTTTNKAQPPLRMAWRLTMNCLQLQTQRKSHIGWAGGAETQSSQDLPCPRCSVVTHKREGYHNCDVPSEEGGS